MTQPLSTTQATSLRYTLSDLLRTLDKEQPPAGTTAAVVLALRQMSSIPWARSNACAMFARLLEDAEGLDWSKEDLTKAISLLDDWRYRG